LPFLTGKNGKHSKNFLKNLEFYLTPFASIASIIGVILIAFNDKTNGIIALSCLIIFLLALYIRLYILLNRMIQNKYPKGVARLSTSFKYSTNDSKYIKYEVYKHIQCKLLFMKKLSHDFKWSGTVVPKIYSKLQNVSSNIIRNAKDYDKVELFFKSPLLYNQVAIIHIGMDLDDSDNKSKTYLETKISQPILQVHFKVELCYKPDNYNIESKLLRKDFESNLNEDFELLELIPFDSKLKSYDYYLLNPEPGYYYRLAWER
jgi:hypothetical protein